jgi:hypothetical protein
MDDDEDAITDSISIIPMKWSSGAWSYSATAMHTSVKRACKSS